MIASARFRSWCASISEAGEVKVFAPGGGIIEPCSSSACFSVTHGRPVRPRFAKGANKVSDCRNNSGEIEAISRTMRPASASAARPRPSLLGWDHASRSRHWRWGFREWHHSRGASGPCDCRVQVLPQWCGRDRLSAPHGRLPEPWLGMGLPCPLMGRNSQHFTRRIQNDSSDRRVGCRRPRNTSAAAIARVNADAITPCGSSILAMRWSMRPGSFLFGRRSGAQRQMPDSAQAGADRSSLCSLPSGLYRRLRNHTGSADTPTRVEAARGLAGEPAYRRWGLSPALRTYVC